MAKRKNDLTPAEDYIDQLQWRSRRGMGMPVRFEPKWKYRISYRYAQTTPLGRIIQFLVLISILTLIFFLVFSSVPGETLGKIIAATLIMGLILVILLFAIRDSSQKEEIDLMQEKDNNEDLNNIGL